MEKEGFTRCWWWCFCAEAKMSGKGPGLFSAIGKIGRGKKLSLSFSLFFFHFLLYAAFVTK